MSSADTYSSPATAGAASSGAGGAGGAAGGGGGGAVGGGGGDEWRRDAPKHAPYLEPVSPPDTHHQG